MPLGIWDFFMFGFCSFCGNLEYITIYFEYSLFDSRKIVVSLHTNSLALNEFCC